jgi:hypothetical protein
MPAHAEQGKTFEDEAQTLPLPNQCLSFRQLCEAIGFVQLRNCPITNAASLVSQQTFTDNIGCPANVWSSILDFAR